MDDRSSSNEALQFNNTFRNAAVGSRQTPGTTSRAEQPGFDSGVAASAPRHNDGDQTGSRRTPGQRGSLGYQAGLIHLDDLLVPARPSVE